MQAAITQNSLLPTIKKLFDQLGVSYSNWFLDRYVSQHTQDISISCIHDVLNEYKIPNIPIKITSEDLTRVECPAIVGLDGQQEEFALLENVEEDHVLFFHPIEGMVRTTLPNFVNRFDGNVILVQKTSYSGEPNFQENRVFDLLKSIRLWAIPILFLIAFGLIIANLLTNHIENILGWIILFTIHLIGLIVSLLLFSKNRNRENIFLNKICKLGTQSKQLDCDQVLNSEGSKLFSWLSLTDIGIIFFGGGLTLLTLSSFIDDSQVLNFLGMLSALALPFTVFSVYYQGLVVKKWCVLCLVIQVLIWIGFLAFFFLGYVSLFSISLEDLAIIALSYLIPISFLFNMKPSILELNSTESELQLSRIFLDEPGFFTRLVEHSNQIPVIPNAGDVNIGNEDADNHILLMISPNCPYCAQVFQELVGLIHTFPNQIKLTIRFFVNNLNKTNLNWLNKIYLLNDKDEKLQILAFLEDWYANLSSSLIDQEEVMISPTNEDLIKQYLEIQSQWMDQHHFEGTPIVLINGKMFPINLPFKYIRRFLK